MDDVIDLKDVWFYYGRLPILEKINFSVKKHDFVGIIGPNGGGKTTLLKIILGIIRPQKGKVKIFGRSPHEGRKKIGYVPQVAKFDREFPISVLEVVLMGRLSRKRTGSRYDEEDRKIAENALKSVDMLEYRSRQINELSGGQLQRVLVARALASEPELLLLDEPMSSIDPEMQKSFYEMLNRLKRKMAILLVTHDVTAASVYIDKIACLNRKLFYHGKTKEGIKHLEETYQCPVELLAHGMPHRVLERHK